jgi:hypothetical protein
MNLSFFVFLPTAPQKNGKLNTSGRKARRKIGKENGNQNH